MNEQRNFATFTADLDDENEFSRSGEVLIPAGKVICHTLTESLRHRKFTISEWRQYEFYGWEAVAELGSQKVWMLLQGGDRWLLICENKNGLLGRFKKRDDYRAILLEIDRAMKENEHLSHVLWFTREEYEKNGDI
jgi:hypothetical protein